MFNTVKLYTDDTYQLMHKPIFLRYNNHLLPSCCNVEIVNIYFACRKFTKAISHNKIWTSWQHIVGNK